MQNNDLIPRKEVEKMIEKMLKDGKFYWLDDGRFLYPPELLQELSQIEGAGTYSGWIAVTEQYPRDGVDVQIFTDYGKQATAHIGNETWIDAMRGQHSYGSVTHWMPLPPPPNKV